MFAEKEEIAEAQRRRPVLVAETSAFPWLEKYLDREFDLRVVGPDSADAPADGAPALMLSTTDVYGLTEGAAISESTAARPGDAREAEEAFVAKCRAAGRVPVILRLPPVVIGTGMTGLPRTLARGVARGTMLIIKGNDAEVSAIHATDAARVARLVMESAPEAPVTVNVAGDPLKISELVGALGVRIKDKRVGEIKPFWAKALYGSSLYRDLTTTLTFDNSAVKALLPDDFAFTNPAEYLKTHVYDHESL